MIELFMGFAVIAGVCIAVLFGVVRWVLAPLPESTFWEEPDGLYVCEDEDCPCCVDVREMERDDEE